VQGNSALGTSRPVKGHQRRQVQVGQHIPVDHHERVLHPTVGGREADGTSGVERLGLDGIDQGDAGSTAVGVGLPERVGEIAQRQDRPFDTVYSQVPEYPFEHGHADNRQHLLRR
jgi:hypothetical protein